MKRRILFISLVLVLVLTALMPAAALAKNDGRHRPSPSPVLEDFYGSGIIYVTYMPPPEIKGKMWRYTGEIAEGFLLQSDWDLLAGAGFWSGHDSFVLVQKDGSAKGIMKGEFALIRPDGSGVLEGVFEGKITGNLFTGFISDAGTWRSTGGSGVFADVKAWGKWSADLAFDAGMGTLVGPLTWEGKYLQK
jgi:hypothetical protein